MSTNAKRKPRRSPRPSRNQKTAGPQVGDITICPPHGVGEVVAIGPEEISGVRDTYYSLEIIGRDIRVLIPASRATGMRNPIGPKEVDRVFALLGRKHDFRYDVNWTKRQKELRAKIHSGCIFDSAEVLRDLMLVRRRKELSVGEQKLLDEASHRVVTELAHAAKRTVAQIDHQIDAIFSPEIIENDREAAQASLAAESKDADSRRRSRVR